MLGIFKKGIDLYQSQCDILKSTGFVEYRLGWNPYSATYHVYEIGK